MRLAPTVLVDAILDQKPALSTNGVLHLIGHFPTTPQEVVFDMTFAYEAGTWRIAVLSVGTRLASDQAAPAGLATDVIPPAGLVAPSKAAKPKPKP